MRVFYGAVKRIFPDIRSVCGALLRTSRICVAAYSRCCNGFRRALRSELVMTPTEEARIIAETEARIVQWLRKQARDDYDDRAEERLAWWFADHICIGDHRKDQTNGE